jgi:long-chain acyl-CoA synthetase
MSIVKELNFHTLLDNSARMYSGLPALSFVGGEPLTYKDVKYHADALSQKLFALGVRKGDRVALLSQNMPNWGVSYLAVTSMGAVVVPILVDFSAPEIENILSHCEARVIIVSEKQSAKLHQPLPKSLKAAILADDFSQISLGSLELNGTIDRKENADGTVTGKTGTGSAESLTVPSESEDALSVPAEDDLAAILYTSGTTGNPKGVMLSHRNILSNAVNTLGIQPVDQTDRLLSVLPLPHTYECTIGFIIPFMMGASVYYLDKLPTPAVLLPAMQAVKPTMMLTVPLIIEKVYQNRVKPKLTGSPVMRFLGKNRTAQKFFHKLAGKKIYKAFGGKLHFFGIGGAKLNAEAERFLRDAGFPYAIGYGLTETSPLLAGCGPKLTKFQSTGFNLPGQDIKIDNPDPDTGEGEILARGPNIMKGYYKEEQVTKDVFTEDGWFKTGDLGSMDADGYLYIRGRLKNIIISPTGENIYPEDIEAVINSEHHVLESLVYELKGKLVAKVHLNYEEIDQRYHHLRESAGESYQNFKETAGERYQDLKDSASNLYGQAQEKVKLRLQEIQHRVNSRLNRFSRLTLIEEQHEPFEKTPTKKIKRFLYHQK